MKFSVAGHVAELAGKYTHISQPSKESLGESRNLAFFIPSTGPDNSYICPGSFLPQCPYFSLRSKFKNFISKMFWSISESDSD